MTEPCAAEAHALERLKDPNLTEGKRALLQMHIQMIHNPPACETCGKSHVSLNMLKDFRGNLFAVVCDKCRPPIDKMLDTLFHKYGGYIDEHGTVQASCHGSPTIQSIDQLKQEVVCIPSTK
jgi:hypothetical protein